MNDTVSGALFDNFQKGNVMKIQKGEDRQELTPDTRLEEYINRQDQWKQGLCSKWKSAPEVDLMVKLSMESPLRLSIAIVSTINLKSKKRNQDNIHRIENEKVKKKKDQVVDSQVVLWKIAKSLSEEMFEISVSAHENTYDYPENEI